MLDRLRFGDLIRLVSPDSGTTDFRYDEAGNLTKDTRIVSGSVVSVRERRYDDANRLELEYSIPDNVCYRRTYDSADASPLMNRGGRLSKIERQEFNGSSNCTSATVGENQYVSTSYGYDLFGGLDIVETELYHGSGNRTVKVNYDFDAVGNLNAVEYPSGRTVNFGRGGGRITNASWTAPVSGTVSSLASAFSYFPFGGVEQMTFANNWTIDRGFDSSGRLSSEHAYDSDPVTGDTLYRRTYEYDAFSNVNLIKHFDRYAAFDDSQDVEESYTYDERHRLTIAALTESLSSSSYLSPYGTRTYTYDASGNRIRRQIDIDNAPGFSLTYAHEADSSVTPQPLSNRVVSVTEDSSLNSPQPVRRLQYDDRGNLTLDERSGANRTLFQYDDRNRLVAGHRVVVPEPNVPILLLVGTLGLVALRSSRRLGRRERKSSMGGARSGLLMGAAVAIFLIPPAVATAQDEGDGDGIPDLFEIATQSIPSVLPLQEFHAFDATQDYDGDGATNLEEYLALIRHNESFSRH